MNKNKLLILFSLSVLSVYVIGRMGGISPASAVDATTVAPKSMAPAVPATSGGLQIKVLNTGVMQPSNAQKTEIQQGTFTSNVSNRCPNTLSCGTPNNSLVGTATCPNVCYVTSTTGGPPPALPFSYPNCPSGYAALTTGKSDISYKYSGALSSWPSSQTQMEQLQSQGYTCSPVGSTAWGSCPDSGNIGDYVIRNGLFYKITGKYCASSAGGVSYCNWAVSCGVSNFEKLTLERVRCDRAAGYYPGSTIYNPDTSGSDTSYQTIPLEVICGRVSTAWSDG